MLGQKNVDLYKKFILLIIIFLFISRKQFLFNYKNINYINSFGANIFFNISSINYYFSYKFNKIEVEYNLQFFDKENNIIIPSDLSLYYNLHVFCILKDHNNLIQSISNIYQNKYFVCLEYSELNKYSKFEIKICKDSYKCLSFYLFDSHYFNYNNLKLLKDDIFDFNYINENFSSLSLNIQKSKDELYSLKKCYISKPICSIKEKAVILKNFWHLKNIYNHYFCFCNGHHCKIDKNLDICKYYLYLSIIDKNKYLYKKTYYLFFDFLYSNRAPGDAFFIFREMDKQNISAFYLTERKDIYAQYFSNSTKFQRIIPIINRQYEISGNILEKYLNFFLKLKVVISGSQIDSKENIFFKIPYITFICLGHGVNFFKPFLYKDYYGCGRYNKILLSSKKIISLAKKYGWKDENIIKIGLPKWDLFDNYTFYSKNEINEKCIFSMFTWRNLKKDKNISSTYFNNIQKLLNHQKLNQLLFDNNITLYLSLHHNLLNEVNKFENSKKFRYINQEEIITCLMKCDLVISDFSSIIFDFMYRKKPIIIYIPDSEDKFLNELYDDDYLNIINSLKNNSIKFENKVSGIDEAIKKIEYYILNNFHLDEHLKTLYKKFNLFGKNNINKFIEYLKSLS